MSGSQFSRERRKEPSRQNRECGQVYALEGAGTCWDWNVGENRGHREPAMPRDNQVFSTSSVTHFVTGT